MLADGKRIGANQTVLACLTALANRTAVIKNLRLSLHVQATGELAIALKTGFDGSLHRLPHIGHIEPKIGALIFFGKLPKANILLLAIRADIAPSFERVMNFRCFCRFAVYLNTTATHAQNAQATKFASFGKSHHVHCVGVGNILAVGIPNDLAGHRIKGLANNGIGAVTFAGFGKRTVKRYAKFIGCRELFQAKFARALGTNCV